MALISAQYVCNNLLSASMRMVDARFVLQDADAGRAAYTDGHIPGAVYVDLNQDLSAEKSNPLLGRHPLPHAAHFAKVLERLGITPDTEVVVYDQADGSMAASRLWFLLRLAGHTKAFVLDGGLNRWLAHGFPLTKETPVVAPSVYQVRFDNEKLVTAEQLKVWLIEAENTVLLDARASERFRGEVEPLDIKAGHIPGAVSRPFTDNLHEGLFKSTEQLHAEFAPLITGKKNIVLSCGSGVTACHNALALSHAGIENYRLFAPSWSGWIADDTNAVALG